MVKLPKSKTKNERIFILKFIYVCTEDDRDKLLDLGFNLLGQKDVGTLWAFEASDNLSIDLDAVLDAYVLSNTLMF